MREVDIRVVIKIENLSNHNQIAAENSQTTNITFLQTLILQQCRVKGKTHRIKVPLFPFVCVLFFFLAFVWIVNRRVCGNLNTTFIYCTDQQRLTLVLISD